jgi:hypothetical protein
MPDSWRRLSAHDEAGGSLGDPLLVDIRQIVDLAQSHSATGEPVAHTDGFLVVPLASPHYARQVGECGLHG